MHFNSEFETVPNVINEPFGSMYSAAMIVHSVHLKQGSNEDVVFVRNLIIRLHLESSKNGIHLCYEYSVMKYSKKSYLTQLLSPT